MEKSLGRVPSFPSEMPDPIQRYRTKSSWSCCLSRCPVLIRSCPDWPRGALPVPSPTSPCCPSSYKCMLAIVLQVNTVRCPTIPDFLNLLCWPGEVLDPCCRVTQQAVRCPASPDCFRPKMTMMFPPILRADEQYPFLQRQNFRTGVYYKKSPDPSAHGWATGCISWTKI